MSPNDRPVGTVAPGNQTGEQVEMVKSFQQIWKQNPHILDLAWASKMYQVHIHLFKIKETPRYFQYN